MPSKQTLNSDTVTDKNGSPIEVGDHVWVNQKYGHREGDVTDIVTSKEEAAEKGVKHPPKVLFDDQHGCHVSHNPASTTKDAEEGKTY